ncbi:p-loop containing nucleoside triphosphate hydrolase [Fusarium flagelliforme]|uniref:p-loop containing nucleoside triphosphate hydrolase n=1 Tax=Fusarium flagelliforme TaxID=2675880 RepID=A0A395MVU7_9HYPO|nr:p-loop containing nucleoside triphosphate hydrolase [Fusarium flagelliforme]
MDPASAIGVTSAVITFLEFSWKVVRNAKEIYDSADGCPNDNLTRESVARSMQAFSRKLQPPDPSAIPPEYQGICELSNECQSISSEILTISDSLKIGGEKSRYKALRTGFKAWKFKKDLVQLEERLARCGDQLSLELSYLKSGQIMYSLEQIRSLARDDTSKLQQIQQSIDELRQATEVDLGTDILTHVLDILQRQDRALDRVCQDRILRSLCSSDMDSRYHQVHLPADGTFTWVLGPEERERLDYLPKDDEYWVSRERQMQLQSNKKFVNWLAISDGIFHVSGKLGSGKSTLMKLLYTHPRTKKELEVWSGSKTLFTAKFFFWKPGTNSQNSLNGLYRSLLHSILTEYPDLIPSVLPSYWDQAKKDTAAIQNPFPITPEIIESSLFMLLKNESFYESRRLCIFIDGLDECVGGGQHDYRTLVDTLDTWVQGSNNNLKFCVSSREDNVFMNRYEEHQRLRLHEMSWYDLRKYTQANLSHLQDKALLKKLCFEVSNKAQGIFLWCTLVVQTLRREIEVDPHNSLAGSPMRESSIMRLLDELPVDLEEIFRYILNRLSRQERRNLYQTLSMLKVSAAAAEKHRLPLWLISYSFLDDYNNDPGFALYRKPVKTPIGGSTARDERLAYALRKLQHESGGLLEGVRVNGSPTEELAMIGLGYRYAHFRRPLVVSYAHRSVPEILEGSEVASEKEAILGSFNAADAIVNLTLAHLRLCVGATLPDHHPLAVLTCFVSAMSSDQEGFEFLDTLDLLYEDIYPESNLPETEIYLFQNTGLTYRIGWVTPNHHTKGHGRMLITFNTMFIALEFERYDYVLWKIKHRAAVMDSPIKKAILAALLFDMPKFNDGHLQDELFNVGCFESSSTTGFTQLPYDGEYFRVRNVECMTIWRDFLAMRWHSWYQALHMDQHRFGHWLEMFLKRGALCEFELVITRSTVEEFATLTLGEVEVKIWPMYETDSLEYQKTLEATRTFESDTVYSLTDWIRIINLPNLDRILSLLEENNTVLSHHYPKDESLQNPETVAEVPSVRLRMQTLTNRFIIALLGTYIEKD